MAASGFTPISLYYSATGAAVPSAGNLVAGELALNTNDGKLYYKNSSGVVTLLAGATAGPAGGSTTQVQYNNAGVLAGITGATTNGTTLTLVAPVLGTPASGIVTNLTGTASININGTVGATTANTGAFTTISASGTSTMAAINASGAFTGTTGVFNNGTTGITLGAGLNGEAASVGSIGLDSGATALKIRMNSGGYYFPFALTNAGAFTFSNNANANTVVINSTGLSVTGTSTMAAINASGNISQSSPASTLSTGYSHTLTNAASTASMTRSIDASGNVIDRAYKATGATYANYVHTTGDADLLALSISAAGAVTIPGTLGVTGDITGSGSNGFKTGADNRGLYFNGSRNAILGSNAADTVTIAAANAAVALFGAASTSLTGTLGVTGTITPGQTTGIVGTTTNNNAQAGSVGEVISSSVDVVSAVSLTDATGAFTGKTITSISLTAGDWDVYGIVGINMAATTKFTAIAGGISTTNDTLNGLYEEETRFSYGAAGLVPANVITFTFPTTRVSIASTTTYYLIGYASFSISTATAFGRISARRRR